MATTRTWYLNTVLSAAAIIAAGGTAHAAGFGLLEQSAVAQGNAYAGAGARADDPSMMFYNPASITKLPGVQVSAGLSGIFPEGRLQSGTATTGAFLGATPSTGVTGTNSGSSAGLPNFSVTAQALESLFVGLSVTSPFGLATKYPSNSIARYYALTTQLQTINIGPTVAWQALPQLSVGGGLNVEFASAHLSNAVDFGAIGALHGLGAFGLLPGRADGSATVRGDDTALGWNAGLLYEPWTGTRVGLAYRSAIFHKLNGTVTYYGAPAPLAASFPTQTATAKVPEPSSATLSVAQEIGNWTLLGSVTYNGWSVFRTLTAYNASGAFSVTPENFRDTVSVAIGADYRVNEKLTVRAGTMYDPTPVQDAYRTPRLADSSRTWLSVGATYKPLPSVGLSIAYSHLFANNASVNLTDAGPGTPNLLRGNLSASYALSIDIISAQASFKF